MLLHCSVQCSVDDLNDKVPKFATKILNTTWNYINPDCDTGFVVFMSWQQNKVCII